MDKGELNRYYLLILERLLILLIMVSYFIKFNSMDVTLPACSGLNHIYKTDNSVFHMMVTYHH